MKERIIVAVVAVAILLGGCSGSKSPTAGPDPVTSPPSGRPQTMAFVTSLRAHGATPQIIEEMRAESFPFFAARATRLDVQGENVYVFEYGSTVEAEVEARRISPDGSEIGATKVDWISDPHFYRSDRLIVLYVGRSADLRRLLGDVAGTQIAGRT